MAACVPADSSDMLRVWSVSGEELPAVSIDEVDDVRSLKHLLRATSLAKFQFWVQAMNTKASTSNISYASCE